MLLAQIHVVVDNAAHAETGPFGLGQPTWAAISALVSTAVAVVTAILAVYTRNMANQTRDLVSTGNKERDQVERHHQQSMMPLVSLSAQCKIETIPDQHSRITFWGLLSNFGPGPSTGVNVLIKPCGHVGRAHYLGTLGPGHDRPFEVSWEFDNEQVYQYDRAIPYEVLVRFKSIFETEGAILIESTSGLSEHACETGAVIPGPSSSDFVAALVERLGYSPSVLEAPLDIHDLIERFEK